MNDHPSYDLVGIGGAHLDRIGFVRGNALAGVSNPGVMRECAGGGMFNALRVARLCGVADAALVSVRGGDATAIALEAALEDAGIADLSGRFLDRQSASYTAIHTADGDVITALADMAIYETCLPRHIRRKPVAGAIAGARAVIIDANMPDTAIKAAAGLATGQVFAMAISPAKVGRLAGALGRIDWLFANTRELAALAGTDDVAAALATSGLRNAIITNGAAALSIITDGAIAAQISPPPCPVVDVTGAGDALTGGTIAALLAGAGIVEAVQNGMACAACALAVHGPLHTQAQLAQFAALKAQTHAIQQRDQHGL